MRTSRAFHHPELDTLRFGAFFLVFVHHLLPHERSAYVRSGVPAWLSSWAASAVWSAAFGVDLFFVLSAYLITELLLRERETTGSFALGRFYARRALRIWPLYFAFLAFAVVALRFFIPYDRLPRVYLLGFLAFVGNWVIAVRGWPLSATSPLWSVSVEEQFYLLWPLALTKLRGRAVGVAAFVLIAVAMAWRVGVQLWLPQIRIPATTTLSKVDTIGAGIALAYLLDGHAPRLSRGTRVALAAAGLVTLSLLGIWRDGWFPVVATAPLACAAAVALLLATLHDGAACPRWLQVRPLTFLGRISYGLYVFHMAVTLTVFRVVHSLPRAGVIALTLTIAVASASYLVLEKPFLKLKDKLSVVRRTAAPPG